MSTKNTPNGVEAEQLLATGDQVGGIHDLGNKLLRRLPRDHAQALLANGGIYIQAYSRMLDEVLSRLTGIIVCRIKPDRTRTPQQAIDATRRVQYANRDVVVTMPMGEGNEEVEMTFFKPGRRLTPMELAAEYDVRDLEPDPIVLAAINEADPAFADTTPNGTQWPLPGGGYGFMAFHCDDVDRRCVGVGRRVGGWGGGWSFGGVRKKKALGS
ncbi:MAG: hypothetical protein Q7S16_03875 [bacterium]|nr:hypothetical protein [bacterium]